MAEEARFLEELKCAQTAFVGNDQSAAVRAIANCKRLFSGTSRLDYTDLTSQDRGNLCNLLFTLSTTAYHLHKYQRAKQFAEKAVAVASTFAPEIAVRPFKRVLLQANVALKLASRNDYYKFLVSGPSTEDNNGAIREFCKQLRLAGDDNEAAKLELLVRARTIWCSLSASGPQTARTWQLPKQKLPGDAYLCKGFEKQRAELFKAESIVIPPAYTIGLHIQETDNLAKTIASLPSQSLWALSFVGLKLSNAELESCWSKIAKLQVRDIDLSYTNVSCLTPLNHVTGLRSLQLIKTGVDDGALAKSPPFSELLDLNLSGTRVTDAGLTSLCHWQSLQQLHLCGCRITDDGVVYLAGLPILSMLDLSCTDVTDNGLVELSKIKSLTDLRLDGTKITLKGVQNILSLPHLKRLSIARTLPGKIPPQQKCKIVGP